MNKYYFVYTQLPENHGDNGKDITSEDVKEESDHDKEDQPNGTSENIGIRMHEEVEEGESEDEGNFPNEDGDGGEEIDEDKISKPKTTSDSDEEAPVVPKEESTDNVNLSAKQRSAPKKLMNQFNFFERCTLTEEIILRVS